MESSGPISARAPRPLGSFAIADTVRDLAQGELRKWAAVADTERRLCLEGMRALEEASLASFFVPTELGGMGGTLAEFADIAASLGAGCLSTAMNWVMHSHQVAVLVEYGGPMARPILERVSAERLWIASVTSERQTGSGLLNVEAALRTDSSRLRLQRHATYVSYGEHASFFLISMRASEESSTRDVRLVLVERGDGDVAVQGEWQSMGLRGTASVPMSFDVTVDPSRVLLTPMSEIIVQTMAPLAHVGWCAAWLGAARGSLREVVAKLRDTRSERVLHKLGELRLSLDLGEALLERVIQDLDGLRVAKAPIAAYEEVSLNLRVNELKVAGARIAFEVVDGLVQLVGLREGYLQGRDTHLERLFRDLRAASLMLNDDGLLAQNGRLVLTEDTGLARPR